MAALEERKFLHDISTPLAASLFSIEMLLEDLGKEGEIQAQNCEVLAHALAALVRIAKLIEERRAIVKGQKSG